ncbi:hypothetical protein LRP88_09323 [Fusarium phalaenopsidis]
MELVGIVRCPVGSLLPYGEGRQINPDAVRRLAKSFEITRCRQEEEENFIHGIITHDDLKDITSALGISEKALKCTTRQKNYPLLSGLRIACLDGRHRIRASIKHQPLSWWVVKLLRVQGSWVEFPLKISLASVDSQIIQDRIEATSRETPYSDAEVYRLVRKYMNNHDKARVADFTSRLSSPKQVSLKGLLKRPKLVSDLDALIKFPGVIGGLQLGNVHKHLALHCDENFSFALRHILHVWEYITEDNPRTNAAITLHDVQCLQLRAPIASHGDRVAIGRMFDDGTLLRGIEDLDVRDRVRQRILSLQVIIPSIETFHENMKFFSIGAKILRKYLMEAPTSRKGKPTLFESLSSKWNGAAVQYVECEPGEITTSSETPTQWHAYTTVFLAALRDFARLSFEHPRQDVRGETMPAFPESPQIIYLAHLAIQVGFDNPKIRETLELRAGHPEVAQYKPQDGDPADWRGGIPFTKTYLQLRSQAFIPQLAQPISRERTFTPIFVIRDIMNAFFGGGMDLARNSPDNLTTLVSPAVSEVSGTISPETNRTFQAQPEDVTMEDPGDNVPTKGPKPHKRAASRTLGLKARRVEDEEASRAGGRSNQSV